MKASNIGRLLVKMFRVPTILLVATFCFLATKAGAQVHPIVVPKIEAQKPVTLNLPRVQAPAISIRPIQAPVQPLIGANGVPSNLPFPLTRTPANDEWVRQQSNHNLDRIQASASLAARQGLQTNSKTTILSKPTSLNRYNIQFSNDQVQAVQSTLRRLGYYPGQVDGIFGPETQRAVQSYQSANQLPPTGQPDRTVLTRLGIL